MLIIAIKTGIFICCMILCYMSIMYIHQLYRFSKLSIEERKELTKAYAVQILTKRYLAKNIIMHNILYITWCGKNCPNSVVRFFGDNSRTAIRVVDPSMVLYKSDGTIEDDWSHTPLMYYYHSSCHPDIDIDLLAKEIMDGGDKLAHLKVWADLQLAEYEKIWKDIEISADPDVHDDYKKYHI